MAQVPWLTARRALSMPAGSMLAIAFSPALLLHTVFGFRTAGGLTAAGRAPDRAESGEGVSSTVRSEPADTGPVMTRREPSEVAATTEPCFT